MRLTLHGWRHGSLLQSHHFPFPSPQSSRINELEMDLFDRTNEIDELKALVESQQANIALDTAKTLADMELKVTRNEQMGLDLKKSVDAMAEKLAVSVPAVHYCLFHSLL